MSLYGCALDANGDLPVRCRLITGRDLLEQRIGAALGLHLGEWFADPRLGLPWRTWAQQRPPDVTGIGAALRLAVEAIPTVARVDDWTGAWTPTTRQLVYTAKIRTLDGDGVLTITAFGIGVESVIPAVVFRLLAGAGVLTR